MEECAGARAVLVVFGEAAVDVGESRPDAVLVAFEGGQVDGVGEVRDRWEPSELNGGKLCEVVYTICKGWLEGGTYPVRAEKPSRFPNKCWDMESTYQRVPNSRSARILIPRMMMGLYDIRNNRGVGHAGAE
ncbi:MAG: hypothetical protein WCG47_13815, partial [Dermatophilaceae bacterium]